MPEYERIISLAPSNTEILYELGVEDRVIATTAVCEAPEEAGDKPSVGGWTNPDIEEVEQHEPDLVLASDELQSDAVARCEDAGLPVKQLTPTTFQDVFNSIKQVGELVERAEETWELVERLNEEVKDLAGPTENRTRIYCEEWGDPPMVGGNWIPGMVEMIGGEYLIEEGERSREVSAKEVKEFNPKHIVLHYCGFGDDTEPGKVLEREGWEGITAVEERNVHVLDDSLLNRPGPRLVEGMKAVREIIHGSEQSRM